MNFTKFPRRSYLQGPTPIESMPSLSKALGGNVNLYVKRDDLLPGSGGGNKTRKLEFCIADALDKGADAIITCGAVQSNHARLTAAWSAKEGLDCHLILEERVKGSYKEEASGNNFLFELLDVKSIGVVAGGSDMMAEMGKKADELATSGKTPYIVPGGASNAIGAMGYAVCAEETMGQLNAMRLVVDHIIVPSGYILSECNAGIVARLNDHPHQQRLDADLGIGFQKHSGGAHALAPGVLTNRDLVLQIDILCRKFPENNVSGHHLGDTRRFNPQIRFHRREVASALVVDQEIRICLYRGGCRQWCHCGVGG